MKLTLMDLQVPHVAETHPLVLTDDDVACRDSWKRIHALGAITICPAHGTAP